MIELVFIHLPKTGGSTILKMLQAVYGEECVMHFERHDCLELAANKKKISDVVLPQTRVIHGHFMYNEVKNIIKKDKPKVVTFLRNPVDRVISNYNWWQHALKTNAEAPEKHRINEPIESYIGNAPSQNKMSRFLKGAKLKDFFFVGFLEFFDADIKTLATKLNWPDVVVMHEKNSANFAPKKQGADDALLRNKIEKYNRKDVKLYTQALQMWRI